MNTDWHKWSDFFIHSSVRLSGIWKHWWRTCGKNKTIWLEMQVLHLPNLPTALHRSALLGGVFVQTNRHAHLCETRPTRTWLITQEGEFSKFLCDCVTWKWGQTVTHLKATRTLVPNNSNTARFYFLETTPADSSWYWGGYASCPLWGL